MEVVTGSTIGCSVLLTGTVLVILFWLWIMNFNYWKIRGVPYLQPNWFFGNCKELLLGKCTWAESCNKYYQSFKDNGFGGIFIFRSPVLIICHPTLIEKVLVEDFAYFENRMMLENHEMLTKSLYFSTGENWRTMRSKLISIFSPKKIKGMFLQIMKCCDIIVEQIDRSIEKEKTVEIEPLIFLYSTEVIASCTFGIQMMSDPSESKKYIEIFNSVIGVSSLKMVRNILAISAPKIARIFKIKLVNRQVTDFFARLTKEIIQYRLENNIKRNDFLQFIRVLGEEENYTTNRRHSKQNESDGTTHQLNNLCPETQTATYENLFTDDCIASLMFNFMTSGPVPTYATVSFALLEVAKNASIQNKLQEVIDLSIKKHHGWTFEALNDMRYLDQVIQETLRLYTYSPSIIRIANKPYQLPGTNVTLDKGMPVYIPLAGIHMDPRYYPSPEEFSPERFEGNNYKSSPTFMPFGHGPRICICIKFAVIMMKVCIAKIIYKYKVHIAQNMEAPLTYDRHFLFPRATGGIWLSLENREGSI